MTISATTQGIRPGVATSTNRPAVPFDGQVIFETDTENLKAYNGSDWVTQNGLQLIKTQTIGSAVSSIAVANAFSSAYNNYKITVTGGVGSANTFFNMILTGSTASYNNKFIYGTPGDSSVTGLGNSAGAAWQYVGSNSTSGQTMNMDIYGPFLAAYTTFTATVAESHYNSGSAYGTNSGIHGVATSYTGFTLSCQSGTATGGTIRVYGYANS